MMYTKTLMIYFLFLFYIQAITGSDYLPIISAEESLASRNNKTLFIFLDDSESNDNANTAVTDQFCYAFDQRVSPIIVSASILHNVIAYQKPTESDPQKLDQRLGDLLVKKDQNTSIDREINGIYFHILAFKKNAELSWIIKKINNELYLLIPKQYITSLYISDHEVEKHIISGQITNVELKLGLKVNHMHTITDVSQIKRPNPSPYYADYFSNILADIFVTTKEYNAMHNQNIPLWIFFNHGHGLIAKIIIGLSIKGFKTFLHFLDTNIRTKFLLYGSCFSIGVNSALVYKDAQQSIDTYYSFPIIAIGLTDVPSASKSFTTSKSSFAPVKGYVSYDAFIKEGIKDIPDYKKLVRDFGIAPAADTLLRYTPSKADITHSLSVIIPLIKYPGLPWFSILDDEYVVSIGSILAKNRTKPLDLETFFLKKNLLGVLLYAHNLPFTIIVDTQNNTGNPPEMISMIPGNVVHHIKEIFSSTYTALQLIDSFMKVQPGTHKIFVIDELWGKGTQFTNVVIHCSPTKNSGYYQEKSPRPGLLIRKNNKSDVMTSQDEKTYKQLLTLAGPEIRAREHAQFGLDKPWKLDLWGSMKRDLGSWWVNTRKFLSNFYTGRGKSILAGVAFSGLSTLGYIWLAVALASKRKQSSVSLFGRVIPLK